jgi:hypothetical protein
MTLLQPGRVNPSQTGKNAERLLTDMAVYTEWIQDI